MGSGGRACVLLVLIVTLSVTGLSCDRNAAEKGIAAGIKKEPLPGVTLTEKENDYFSMADDLIYDLNRNLPDPGLPHEAGKEKYLAIQEENRRSRPGIILQGIAAYEELDGYKLESGRIFHGESTKLMRLYGDLIEVYDDLGMCEEADKAYEKYKEISGNERLILVYQEDYDPDDSTDRSISLVFPDYPGYGKLRNELTNKMLAFHIEHTRNCRLFDSLKKRLNEYKKGMEAHGE